ncbi:MAG: hypothetical protein MUE68_03880 [Bacteroidetes bacterium]|jgi:hypothetical protein|nr:hypothetical protein [Bacteroidota bacterium]
MEEITAISSSLRDFWLQVLALLPRILTGLVLLIGGWIVAKLVRRATLRVLRFARVDALAEKAGIESFLMRGGISFTFVTILANFVYWVLLLTMLLAVLHSLGVAAAADLIERIVSYLPNVLGAVLVLIFGSLFANLVRTMTSGYLNNIGIKGVPFIAGLTYYAVLFFVLTVALEQLSIGGAILVSAFQIAFGALCLALALAFGLGGREMASRILENIWKNR